MRSGHSSDVKFEIGHVLFIDIVGCSKLLINERSEQIQKLKEIVRGTEQVRAAVGGCRTLQFAQLLYACAGVLFPARVRSISQRRRTGDRAQSNGCMHGCFHGHTAGLYWRVGTRLRSYPSRDRT